MRLPCYLLPGIFMIVITNNWLVTPSPFFHFSVFRTVYISTILLKSFQVESG